MKYDLLKNWYPWKDCPKICHGWLSAWDDTHNIKFLTKIGNFKLKHESPGISESTEAISFLTIENWRWWTATILKMVISISLQWNHPFIMKFCTQMCTVMLRMVNHKKSNFWKIKMAAGHHRVLKSVCYISVL